MKFHLILSLLFFHTVSYAIELPKNLAHNDRIELIKILGQGTAVKLLSNPYPLGGYPGVEIGVSLDLIDVSNLSRLGDKTSETNSELKVSRLVIGKGLYNNIDVFFHFIPLTQSSDISEFGGTLKWSFYELKFLPITFAGLVHFGQLNVNDSFINQNLGTELMMGINVNKFSMYFGGGKIQSRARFMAGTGEIAPAADADSTNTVKEDYDGTHTFVGVSFELLNLFTAIQVDRYTDPVYSAKIGIRL